MVPQSLKSFFVHTHILQDFRISQPWRFKLRKQRKKNIFWYRYVYILHYTYSTFLGTCCSRLNRHLVTAMLTVLSRSLHVSSFDFFQPTEPFHRLPIYLVVPSYNSCLAPLSLRACVNLPKGERRFLSCVPLHVSHSLTSYYQFYLLSLTPNEGLEETVPFDRRVQLVLCQTVLGCSPTANLAGP